MWTAAACGAPAVALRQQRKLANSLCLDACPALRLVFQTQMRSQNELRTIGSGHLPPGKAMVDSGMKSILLLTRVALVALIVALSALASAGCKSTPKVDWNARVGTFTYDQAVAELGPPDKTAKLSDGRTVADWVERRHGTGLSFGIGTGVSTGHTSVGVGQSVGTSYSDRVLRLTFDRENKLVSWSRNY